MLEFYIYTTQTMFICFEKGLPCLLSIQAWVKLLKVTVSFSLHVVPAEIAAAAIASPDCTSC